MIENLSWEIIDNYTGWLIRVTDLDWNTSWYKLITDDVDDKLFGTFGISEYGAIYSIEKNITPLSKNNKDIQIIPIRKIF